jgi:erythromycin esterase
MSLHAPSPQRHDDEISEIRSMAVPLDDLTDLDALLARVGSARYVLLGEASHGTADYYRWRATITRRLVTDHGFSFVAVEGDWPDCFRVNRWVKGIVDQDLAATEVLSRFERWPTWMWANQEVAEFTDWLRHHNRRTGADVGFYGLDVYSLWDSLDVVLRYLGDRHPDALAAAREAFRCFEPYAEDPQGYAWATRLVPASCEDDVVDLLTALRAESGRIDGEPEAELDAEQNAEVVVGAERYYRTMIQADDSSWNVRDHHMTDTLDRLMAHHGPDAKAVVWEHNTHVGDARATDMVAAGMVNVGQLVRERHADEGVVLVGFAGHHGTVIAADFWGAPFRRMSVPPAPPGTHEHLLHAALGRPALVVFPGNTTASTSPWLATPRGHRAIGVVYRQATDAVGNWVPTVMGQRYDALVSFDTTEALHPLHPETPAPMEEQETYPWSV